MKRKNMKRKNMKRKNMKRITALIIAAIMIASMIPVAAVEAETPATQPTYNFVFDLASHGRSSNTNLTTGNFTVEKTVEGYDKWGYVNLTNGDYVTGAGEDGQFGTEDDVVSTDFHQFRTDGSNLLRWYYPVGNGYEYNPGEGKLSPALTLEIEIGKAGTYTPEFKWKTRRQSPKVDLYLVKAPEVGSDDEAAWKTTEEGQAAYKAKLSALSGNNDAVFLGNADLFYDNSSPQDGSSTFEPFEIDEAGRYYLIIIPNGGNAGFVSRVNNGSTTNIYVTPASLSLTEIPNETTPDYEYKLSQVSHGTTTANLTTGDYTVEKTADGFDRWGYVNLTAVDGDAHNVRALSREDTPWDVYWTYPKTNGWEYNPAAEKLPPALTLEIVIEDAGAFTPKLSYTTSRHAPIVDLYLVKAPVAGSADEVSWKTTEEGQTAYKEKLSSLGNTAELLGSVDMYDNASTGFLRSNELDIAIISEPGSYYLVLVPNGANSGSRLLGTGTSAQILPSTFSLTATGNTISCSKIEASISEPVVYSFSETGSKINIKAFDNEGSELDIADYEGLVEYSYESLTPNIVSVTDAGYIKYVSKGTGTVKVTANVGGVVLTDELEVVSSSLKTERTVFTNEMVENARDNISKYSWAQSAKSGAVSIAESYLANLDKIYDMITYEGIPRSFTAAIQEDPNAYDCVYCGIDIRDKYGNYSWRMDPLNSPWKIKCPNPSCQREFPSNDFGSFYELGLDQKGQFDRMRALEAHREKFVDKTTSPASPGTEWSADWCAYYGYGLGYLKNDTYDDKAATWAVDDGYGWYTGEGTTKSGYPLKKSFIAYYNHFLYSDMSNTGSQRTDVIIHALNNFRLAYVYTGEDKYGIAGAILTDRLADVYPSYDLNQHALYQNSHGGRKTGKILGSIWETTTAKALIQAYDAFYPIMDNAQVTGYLSEKAAEFGFENPKTTGDMIRENCEMGILREVFKAAKAAKIEGNFGMHQEVVALAGIALDTYPESAEMFEWIAAGREDTVWVPYPQAEYPDISVSVKQKNTGGEILTTIMNDVDRDGFGNEVSATYNALWVSRTLNLAEAFHRYKKYDKLNLYENVKYAKMLSALVHMTVGSGYTLQLGDHSGTGSLENSSQLNAALVGFERLGDPTFAQIAYSLKNGNLSGTYIDIYEKDAGDIAERIGAAIQEHGELSLGSRNLTGYGLAVLADEKATEGSGASSGSDTGRDTWLWYGDTTASHGHKDKLQMGIDAYGFNFTPDLGYPVATGTNPNRLQWVATTLSHNTVVVDGEEQSGTNMGTPMHYDADGIVKVIDAEADDVYTATDIYRRTLVTVEASDDDAYTVDFFRVRGGEEHVYSFHTQSKDGVTVDGLELTQDPVGTAEVGSYAGPDVEYGDDPDTRYGSNDWSYVTRYPRGYTWLKNVRRDEAPTSGNFSVNFKQTDFRNSVSDSSGLNLRFTALNDWTPSSVGVAAGEPPRTKNNTMIPYLDYMLIHRTGDDLDTLFTSVLQPYNGEEYIDSMRSVALTSGGGETADDTAKAVKVKLKTGRIDYIIYATNNNVVYTLTDADNGVSFNFKGFVGVYSVNESNGELENVYSYVNDGGLIGELEATARYTGSVVSFTEELAEENFITVKLDDGFALTDEDVADLAGEYIYINNNTTENGVYKIEKAEKSGDNLVLDIGAVTNIIAYKSDSDPNLGYVYNIENGQAFYIPLSATGTGNVSSGDGTGDIGS